MSDPADGYSGEGSWQHGSPPPIGPIGGDEPAVAPAAGRLLAGDEDGDGEIPGVARHDRARRASAVEPWVEVEFLLLITGVEK